MGKFYYTTPGGEYNIFTDYLLREHHLLIGGMTGSGKNVLIDNIMYRLLLDHPNESRFILIDPKKVELWKYHEVPHVLGYASEVDDVLNQLDYAIRIMDSRYNEMRKQGLNETTDFTLYIVIDELADLMVTSSKKITPRLQRIAQLGRAAHIKLIVATQSPSRQTIPAALTLNFTGRIALHCQSDIESRQLIGMPGAEDLPRYGRGIIRGNYGLNAFTIPLVPAEELNARIQYCINQVKPKRFSLFGSR